MLLNRTAKSSLPSTVTLETSRNTGLRALGMPASDLHARLPEW